MSPLFFISLFHAMPPPGFATPSSPIAAPLFLMFFMPRDFRRRDIFATLIAAFIFRCRYADAVFFYATPPPLFSPPPYLPSPPLPIREFIFAARRC
jgi:hypothetical protein